MNLIRMSLGCDMEMFDSKISPLPVTPKRGAIQSKNLNRNISSNNN
tara:strand:- start:9947 stop:10084 length:138 start_codon:yes stop_codon:yes gene_type:complete